MAFVLSFNLYGETSRSAKTDSSRLLRLASAPMTRKTYNHGVLYLSRAVSLTDIPSLSRISLRFLGACFFFFFERIMCARRFRMTSNVYRFNKILTISFFFKK